MRYAAGDFPMKMRGPRLELGPLTGGDFKSSPPHCKTTTYTTGRQLSRHRAEGRGITRRGATGQMATSLATALLIIAAHVGRRHA